MTDDEAFAVRQLLADKIRDGGSVVLSADGYSNVNGESIYVCSVTFTETRESYVFDTVDVSSKKHTSGFLKGEQCLLQLLQGCSSL